MVASPRRTSTSAGRSPAPFSALPFFALAMQCPDEQKMYYGLYREFLLRLAPGAAGIEHAGMGAAITSEGFRQASKLVMFMRARPAVRRTIERMGSDDVSPDHEPVLLDLYLDSSGSMAERWGIR